MDLDEERESPENPEDGVRADAAEETEEAQAAAEEAADGDPSADGDGFELVELELDEEDIVRYLEDDDGNRVGFVLMEDGEEAEYYYVDDEDDGAPADAGDDEFDLGITKEGVAEATQDMNAIYKDGIAVAGELKEAFDDIKAAFDFSFLKK